MLSSVCRSTQTEGILIRLWGIGPPLLLVYSSGFINGGHLIYIQI